MAPSVPMALPILYWISNDNRLCNGFFSKSWALLSPLTATTAPRLENEEAVEFLAPATNLLSEDLMEAQAPNLVSSDCELVSGTCKSIIRATSDEWSERPIDIQISLLLTLLVFNDFRNCL